MSLHVDKKSKVGPAQAPIHAPRPTEQTPFWKLGTDLQGLVYSNLDGQDQVAVAKVCKFTNHFFPYFQNTLFAGPSGIIVREGRSYFGKIHTLIIRGRPTSDELCNMADKLKWLSTQLRTLNFDFAVKKLGTAFFIKWIQEFSKLEHISFRSAPIGYESVFCDEVAVKTLKTLSHLKEFRIHHVSQRHYPSDPVWEALPSWKNLERLTVSSSIPNEKLCEIPKMFPRLNILNLAERLGASGACSDESLVSVLQAMSDRLKEVGLSFISPLIFTTLGSCLHLEVIRTYWGVNREGQIDKETFDALLATKNDALRSMTLHCVDDFTPTPQDVGKLAAKYPNLQDLRVYQHPKKNVFSDVSLGYLKALVSSSPLVRFLDLSQWGMAISYHEWHPAREADSKISPLKKREEDENALLDLLSKFPRLEFIDLSESHLSEQFLQKLGKVVPTLRLLNFSRVNGLAEYHPSLSTTVIQSQSLETLCKTAGRLEYLNLSGTSFASMQDSQSLVDESEAFILSLKRRFPSLRIQVGLPEFSDYILRHCGFSQFIQR